MSGHTPGPWHVIQREWICASNSLTLCMQYEATLQDLHLIAAAPDLLKACEAAKYFVLANGSQDYDQDLFDQLENAIRKATGET